MAGDFSRTLDLGMSGGKSIWQKLHLDSKLFMLLLILSFSGLFVLYSASGQNMAMVYRQATYLLIGFIVMIIIAQFHPRWLQMSAPWMYGVGIIALLLVLLVGVGAKGAQRWLSVFGVFRCWFVFRLR